MKKPTEPKWEEIGRGMATTVDEVKSYDTTHMYVCRCLERIREKHGLGDWFLAFVLGDFEFLPTWAESAKAKPFDISTLLPLGGLSLMSEGGKTKGKIYAREQAFRFDIGGKDVVFGRVIWMFPERSQAVRTCFVLAPTKADAEAFIAAYHAARLDWNSKHPRLMTAEGCYIDEDLRRLSWDEIFLAGDLGKSIQAEIDWFFTNRAVFKEYGLAWRRGMLLAGSPGNGKTAICRAIATSSKVPVVFCQINNDNKTYILNSMFGTVESNLPCVGIIEDIDAFADQEGLRANLLNSLDGVASCEGLFLVATTNSPERLDFAFTGRPSRFDTCHSINNPEERERKLLLQARLGKQAAGLAAQIDRVAKDADDLSAACIQEIATCALMESMRQARPIKLADLKLGLAKVRKHMAGSKRGFKPASRAGFGFSKGSSGAGVGYADPDEDL